MIITVSGPPGSGKSTIAKMLAEKLNWPRYYIGGIRRDIARKKGMTLAEYNKLGETDPRTDLELDEYLDNLGKTQDNFIAEGRTAWHFIPHSLKIYIDVSIEEGAHRLWHDLGKGADRNESRDINTNEDAIKSIKERLASDKLRYKKYYNIDVFDKKNYDLVVDTTNLTAVEAFGQIYEYIKSKLPQGTRPVK